LVRFPCQLTQCVVLPINSYLQISRLEIVDFLLELRFLLIELFALQLLFVEEFPFLYELVYALIVRFPKTELRKDKLKASQQRGTEVYIRFLLEEFL